MSSERYSKGSTGSSEFALALECCGHAFRLNARPPLPLQQEIDWNRFLSLVRFHRVEGIAWNYLASRRPEVPDAIAEELKSAASAIAANNLLARLDCRTLLDAFEAANVTLLFLKGLTLGALAFGNPAVKSAIDVDLLVDPIQLETAADILRRCGYRLIAPADSLDDHGLRRWHKSWKESVWRKDSPRLQIDLHTQTADNHRLIPGITVHSPGQRIDVGDNIRLPTLARDELFAYLAVHGASSAWFRLKWIADFAGFLSGASPDEIDRLYRQSQELGAGRAAGQALILANELFGTLRHNEALLDQLLRDRPTRHLYRTALGLLARQPMEPTGQRWGTFPIHSTQMLLLPGLSYKVSELKRQVRRLTNRAAI